MRPCLKQVLDALGEYEQVIMRAPLAKVTQDNYLAHVIRFVQWMDGQDVGLSEPDET